MKFTGHVIIERGLFQWLANRSQKPPLKWYHKHENTKNVTVQPQTPVGSRDNRIHHLVKFTISKQCMCTRFATSFHCACHTSSVVFFTARHCYALRVLISTEPQTEKNKIKRQSFRTAPYFIMHTILC